MAIPSAYTQHNNTKILTATPAELILMLYEGAIKFCNIAEVAIDHKDIPKAHENLMKVQKIIDYLRKTLDMQYAVAQDFENIYVYLQRRLVEANVKKDKEIVEEVNMHLHAVRDTWKEVMHLDKEKGTV